MTKRELMSKKEIEYYEAHKKELDALYLKYIKSTDNKIKLRASDFIIELIPDESVPNV
jgi:hypothetical protein